MTVRSVDTAAFDVARYAAFAEECDARYAAFLHESEGIAVWQRVRAGEVFRDACRDMRVSLRLQLGALARSLDYATDAATYLEPWYGIGTTAAFFGGGYEWPEGQAPVVRPRYGSIAALPPLAALRLLSPLPPGEGLGVRAVFSRYASSPILRYTLETIEYFLEETQGRLPLSWSDLQAPINVATELVETSGFFLGMIEAPERVSELLASITDAVIEFTAQQTTLIGPALARPGHGFAGARTGKGIGLSTDNLVMISPRMYERFCVPDNTRIGEAFGGVAIHSCGNWARWLTAVRKISNLTAVDAAFSAQTDPDPNSPEAFRDALAGTGVMLQARIVGDPDEVLAIARRLWAPGMRLMVVTYVQDPIAQRKLYDDLHNLVR